MQNQRQASPKDQQGNGFAKDRAKAWETGEYVKALRPQIEELDKACAQVRQIVYSLRKTLGQ